LQAVDRFALARYAELARGIRQAYEAYDFQSVFHAVNDYITVDLSAFYLDVSKDRLYTLAAGSVERRSAQTAMYVIADGLTRFVAPILSMTAEEIWGQLPGSREASVHMAVFPADTDAWLDETLAAEWRRLLDARSTVNVALEEARQQKTIGTSLQAKVLLAASGDLADLLERYRTDLPMLFMTSAVGVERRGSGGLTVTVNRADGEKCPRCWRYVTDQSSDADFAGLCSRCVNAVGGAVAPAR
jgi:isoleucyl-tRNA synthetase